MYEIPLVLNFLDQVNGAIYTSDTTPKTPATPVPKTPTDKKWWEQVISVVPNLVTAIFGAQAVNANPVYTAPTTQGNAGNNNSILIIAAVVIVAVLLMSKGKK